MFASLPTNVGTNESKTRTDLRIQQKTFAKHVDFEPKQSRIYPQAATNGGKRNFFCLW